MAIELLRVKGDTEPLGINWQYAFFKRWPELKTKFLKPQEAKRFLAEHRPTFEHHFRLFESIVERYCVKPENIWNIDEKGVIIGISGKEKVIVSKYEINPHTVHSGNREWVTSTECVSITSKKLASFTIFK